MSTIIRTALALAMVLATSSAEEAFMDAGNWYQNKVTSLSYDFTRQGSYMLTTNMNPTTGKCDQKPRDYDRPSGVFGEEVNATWISTGLSLGACDAALTRDLQVVIAVRGPCKLSKFAVYQFSEPDAAASVKAKAKRGHLSAHQRRHGHQYFHERNAEIRQVQERDVGDLVTATIDGKAVTWTNSYDGGASAPTSSTEASQASQSTPDAASSSPPENAASTSDDDDDEPAPTGDWTRTAYWDSAAQTAEGLVFLNNKGHFDLCVFQSCIGSRLGVGPSSLTLGSVYGNSLSYASCDGSKSASSPQMLEPDLTLPSNTEVLIFSDKKCKDGDCGYVRPGCVAHRTCSAFLASSPASLFPNRLYLAFSLT